MSVAPSRGDLVTISFDPQAGREQKGRRPAIVLSPQQFNAVTGFAILCPITNTRRGWGYEVELSVGLTFEGVILTDQPRSFDWRARGLSIKGQAPQEIVDECLQKIHTFLA